MQLIVDGAVEAVQAFEDVTLSSGAVPLRGRLRDRFEDVQREQSIQVGVDGLATHAGEFGEFGFREFATWKRVHDGVDQEATLSFCVSTRHPLGYSSRTSAVVLSPSVLSSCRPSVGASVAMQYSGPVGGIMPYVGSPLDWDDGPDTDKDGPDETDTEPAAGDLLLSDE